VLPLVAPGAAALATGDGDIAADGLGTAAGLWVALGDGLATGFAAAALVGTVAGALVAGGTVVGGGVLAGVPLHAVSRVEAAIAPKPAAKLIVRLLTWLISRSGDYSN